MDTSAWYPLAVHSHPDHERIAGALRDRVAQRVRLVTSNLVVAESHALIMRRAGRSAALQFVQLARMAPTLVVTSSSALESAAIANWLTPYHDQDFSLADSVSFAIMQDRGIAEALTLDHHFAVAGFQPIPQ